MFQIASLFIEFAWEPKTNEICMKYVYANNAKLTSTCKNGQLVGYVYFSFSLVGN